MMPKNTIGKSWRYMLTDDTDNKSVRSMRNIKAHGLNGLNRFIALIVESV